MFYSFSIQISLKLLVKQIRNSIDLLNAKDIESNETVIPNPCLHLSMISHHVFDQ